MQPHESAGPEDGDEPCFLFELSERDCEVCFPQPAPETPRSPRPRSAATPQHAVKYPFERRCKECCHPCCGPTGYVTKIVEKVKIIRNTDLISEQPISELPLSQRFNAISGAR